MLSNISELIVTWYDETDDYVTHQIINPDAVNLPIFTDTGSGNVNEIRIELKAPYGKRITNGSIIDKYDRFRIQVTDLSGNSYDRYFEVDDISPAQSKEEGTTLTLQCLGIEYHTQQIHFAKPFWFSPAHTPGQIVGDSYNANKGSRQPVLSEHGAFFNPITAVGNGLPIETNSNYEYGFTAVSCYAIWLDLIDRQGAAVRDGGVFDFFELSFDTPTVNSIALKIFSSGSHPESANGTLSVIEKTLSVNPSESEGVVSNPTATRTFVVGDSTSGSLPTGHARYASQIFEFLYRVPWQDDVRYLENSKIQYMGKHYRSLTDGNLDLRPDVNPTTWEQFDMSDEFGDSIQYSEWTDDKAALYVNSGAKPGAVVGIVDGYESTGACMFDGNIVINDNNYFATWVDERSIGVGGTPSQTVSTEFLYADGIWPRGYRFLCVGTGPFPGNGLVDREGKSGNNAVIERVQSRDGQAGTEWVVKYQFNNAVHTMQVAVLSEARVYQWDGINSVFVDISRNDLGNHCFHQYTSLRNVEGLDLRPSETDHEKYPAITKDGTPFETNIKSAIEVVFDFRFAVLDRFISRNSYQSHGAWINFRFPFPVSTHNGISEGVGDIYGGGVASAATGLNEPATLDISNLGYTPSGKLGFNNDDSDALMALTTFSFSLGLKTEILTQTRRNADRYAVFDGRANFRVLMGDTADNVWKSDFILTERNGNIHSFDLELSSFEIYRGRKPRFLELTLANIIELINPKNLDVQNILEQRNIKWISIQLQDEYDEFGRYAPEGNHDITNTDLSDTFAGRHTLILDDVHWKKPLFVHSGADPVRNLEAQFLQREDILLVTQAEDVAAAAEEIEKFQHKAFDITTTGEQLFDIKFGDSFYFKNDSLVSNADMPDPDNPGQFIPHTIKLVAKKIEYSITRVASGRGGAQRRIQGIKRFI